MRTTGATTRSGYVFGNKRNFYNGQPIIISDLGDGKEYHGVVRGKSMDHVIDHYIIELHPKTKEIFRKINPDFEWDCISITEACLRANASKES